MAIVHWLHYIGIFGFALTLLTLPVGIFARNSRLAIGFLWVTCALYLIGVLLIDCEIAIYQIWGTVACLLCGIFIIPILPAALIATALHSQWPWFWTTLVVFIIAAHIRLVGLAFVAKSEK